MRDELLINVQKFATQVLNVVVLCVCGVGCVVCVRNVCACACVCGVCLRVHVWCVCALYLPSRIHNYSTLCLHIVKYLHVQRCQHCQHYAILKRVST